MIERAGLIAAIVWVGLVAIWSATSRGFVWYEWYVGAYHIGPASVVTGAGLCIIAAVTYGVPWILAARK